VIEPGILLDTGPLVALIDKTDGRHAQAKSLFGKCAAPLKTVEAVITEACYLAGRADPRGAQRIIELGETGFYEISFSLKDQATLVRNLMEKYRDIPASLADACLIRCAELHGEARILTFDSDFEHYRWGRSKKFQIFGISS